MTKEINIDFDEFVQVFNVQGKEKAIEYVDTRYNRGYEYVQRRLHRESDYYFDRGDRKYKKKANRVIDADFMSIDELYKGKNQIIDTKLNSLGAQTPKVNFEDIVLDLIKDRIAEFSKYIVLDHGTNKVIIKANAIKNDGFELILT